MGKKIDKETFVKRSISVHGDKYDYSKVNYVNSSTKVCIICPEHGEFWQIPPSHMKGFGCAECGGSKKSTKEQFVEKAMAIHGDKYDYSKVVYLSSKKKVCIVCPEHGEFWQTPHDHLAGKGCAKCSKNYCPTTSVCLKLFGSNVRFS